MTDHAEPLTQPEDAGGSDLLHRRAVLTGGAALAGAAIAALSRSDAAEGGHNTNIAYDSQTVMHVDVTNTGAGSTRISSDISGTAAFVALNNYPVGISRPDGMLGRTMYTTSNCAGVAGTCEAASGGIGVLGTAKATNGTGVYGFAGSVVPNEVAPGGTGVYGRGPSRGMLGRSTTGPGVRGESGAGPGIQGESTSASGVEGTSTTGDGVKGQTSSGVGVLGTATAGGLAGQFVGRAVVDGALETSSLKTTGQSALGGVDASGPVNLAGTLKVTGDATLAGLNVTGPTTLAGISVTGPAMLSGPVALAAPTLDRLSLPKTSGLVTLKRAASSISVANVPVVPGSLVVAMLQKRSTGLFVTAAVPAVSRKRITIHFNKRAPKGTKVAWMVVN